MGRIDCIGGGVDVERRISGGGRIWGEIDWV